jgi:hypothetical protein
MSTPGFTAGASLYKTSGRYSTSAAPAQAGEVIQQQAFLSRTSFLSRSPVIVSVPCVGPNCPSQLPQVGQGDGFPAVPGTSCAQLCIQQYSEALGNCGSNCNVYSKGSTPYQNCLTECETQYGYSVSSSCWTIQNCNGRCVNIFSNTLNCGRCGHACPANAVCSSGFCHCPSGRTLCRLGGSEICANLSIDANNCGSCGNVCATGYCCGGHCVNVGTDPNNCGSCGNVCPQPPNSLSTCVNRTCDFTCNSGFDRCGNVCVDRSSDPNNCGDCFQVCPMPLNSQSTSCVHGTCDLTCNPDFTKCGQGCFDLRSDQYHCGECSKMCAHNEGCCKSQCTDLTRNPNCGSCNNVCESNKICVADPQPGGLVRGYCDCPPGTTWCGDPSIEGGVGCYNLQTDPLRCGSCYEWCDRGQVCANGTCKHTCDPFTDCGSGICKDVNTDPENCGQCGTVCDANEACTNGRCGCIIPCGNACCNPLSQVCENGQCVCKQQGFESCGEGCCYSNTCCDGKVCMTSTDDQCCNKGDGSFCIGGGTACCS